jgi:hypothetical protein
VILIVGCDDGVVVVVLGVVAFVVAAIFMVIVRVVAVVKDYVEFKVMVLR